MSDTFPTTIELREADGLQRIHVNGLRIWLAGHNGIGRRWIVRWYASGLGLERLGGWSTPVLEAAGRRLLACFGPPGGRQGAAGIADYAARCGANLVKMWPDPDVIAAWPVGAPLYAVPVALTYPAQIGEMMRLPRASQRRDYVQRRMEDVQERIGDRPTILGAQWANEPLWSAVIERIPKSDAVAIFRDLGAWWADWIQRRLPGTLRISTGVAGSLQRRHPDLWGEAIAQDCDILDLHNYDRWSAEEINAIGDQADRAIWQGEWAWLAPWGRRDRAVLRLTGARPFGSYPTAEDQHARAGEISRTLHALARQPRVVGECSHGFIAHDAAYWGLHPERPEASRPWVDAHREGRASAAYAASLAREVP